MKKLKVIFTLIVLLAIVGGGCGLYYYYYESTNFYTTENASITANMITLTPEVNGKIDQWNVKEGDFVKAGQVLGHQDISMLVTSGSINSQALSGTADTLLSKADIKTPIDGKVIQSDVVKGEVVAPGSSVAMIADTSNIYINANIEETSIEKIKAGQKVDVTIDAYPGKHFTGYVDSISDAAQSVFSPIASISTSGTFSKVTQLVPVKINLVNADNLKLMLGLNVTVKIHIK